MVPLVHLIKLGFDPHAETVRNVHKIITVPGHEFPGSTLLALILNAALASDPLFFMRSRSIWNGAILRVSFLSQQVEGVSFWACFNQNLSIPILMSVRVIDKP